MEDVYRRRTTLRNYLLYACTLPSISAASHRASLAPARCITCFIVYLRGAATYTRLYIFSLLSYEKLQKEKKNRKRRKSCSMHCQGFARMPFSVVRLRKLSEDELLRGGGWWWAGGWWWSGGWQLGGDLFLSLCFLVPQGHWRTIDPRCRLLGIQAFTSCLLSSHLTMPGDGNGTGLLRLSFCLLLSFPTFPSLPTPTMWPMSDLCFPFFYCCLHCSFWQLPLPTTMLFSIPHRQASHGRDRQENWHGRPVPCAGEALLSQLTLESYLPLFLCFLLISSSLPFALLNMQWQHVCATCTEPFLPVGRRRFRCLGGGGGWDMFLKVLPTWAGTASPDNRKTFFPPPPPIPYYYLRTHPHLPLPHYPYTHDMPPRRHAFAPHTHLWEQTVLCWCSASGL